MDLRPLSPTHCVTPHPAPEELRALAEGGVKTLICNRPDHEVPPAFGMAEMRAAAEAAGLRFVENPFGAGVVLEEAALRQQAALDDSDGPSVAYCASGTRSAALWALAQAGRMPVAEILSATEHAGYPLQGLAPQIVALAEH